MPAAISSPYFRRQNSEPWQDSIPLDQLWLPVQSYSEALCALGWFQNAYRSGHFPTASPCEPDQV